MLYTTRTSVFVQLVYKVKLDFVLEQLASASVGGYGEDVWSELVEEAKTNLMKITVSMITVLSSPTPGDWAGCVDTQVCECNISRMRRRRTLKLEAEELHWQPPVLYLCILFNLVSIYCCRIFI